MDTPPLWGAYQHLVGACERLVGSGRIGSPAPKVVAASLWSFVHGFITLELAEHFVEFDDPVQQMLLPMVVTFAVGLGDTPEPGRSLPRCGGAPFRREHHRPDTTTPAARTRPPGGAPPVRTRLIGAYT